MVFSKPKNELPSVVVLCQEKYPFHNSKIFPSIKAKKLQNIQIYFLHLHLSTNLKLYTMAKSQDAKKTLKKEPLKTAKEKKEEKRDKKNTPKRD